MEPRISPQNLIKRVNLESRIRRPGIYKPILMDALTVLFALGVGYLYKQFLAGTVDYALLLAGMTVFTVISVLQVFFTKGFGHRIWILVLEVAALACLFYNYDLKILGIASAFALIFLFWGEVQGRAELESALEIGFFRTARPVLKKLTTALLLALIILYIPQLNEKTMFVSEATFQKFYDWAAGFVTNFYPEVNFSTSFGKFAEGVARLELKNSPAFQTLSPANQESVIQQTSDDLVKNLNRNFDMAVSKDELASGVLYSVIIKLLNNWMAHFGYYFAAFWALLVFLIFRALGTIFYLIVGFIAFLVYQILLASNFIHVVGEMRTHEIIEF